MKTDCILVLLFLISCSMPRGPVPLSGDAPEATGWTTEVVVEGLEHPWAMVWLSDDSLLITERPGRLRLIEKEKLHPESFGGLPPVFAEGQGGLLDLSLHPDFEENRRVFFTFSSGTENQNQTTVAKGVLDGHELQDVEVIFRAQPIKSGGQHFGSRILWLPDGTFLLSVGDGGNHPQKIDGVLSREYAQMKDAHLGKVLRLSDDGSPPEDNPFVNEQDAFPEIWTLGHRNIQGLALHPETGTVWVNEHGSKGGDELNLLGAGENYGWPEVTYSREYFGPKISSETTKPGMADPKVVWTPTQAPSGLTFYTGNHFPDWRGDLFSGGLAGQQIRRIILNDEEVTGEESLTIGNRVRDIKQGPDGYLYFLTDEENGRLIRIVPE